MWRRFALVVVAAGMIALPAGAVLADGLEGVWLTAGGDSQIEIAPCEDAYCGRIAAVLKPGDGGDYPATDVNNPDPVLRGRPIVGITILSKLKLGDAPNVWEGLVYNPGDGGTYDVTLTLKGDRLKVEGCMAFILCDSQTWTRVQAPLPTGPQALQPQQPAPQ